MTPKEDNLKEQIAEHVEMIRRGAMRELAERLGIETSLAMNSGWSRNESETTLLALFNQREVEARLNELYTIANFDSTVKVFHKTLDGMDGKEAVYGEDFTYIDQRIAQLQSKSSNEEKG